MTFVTSINFLHKSSLVRRCDKVKSQFVWQKEVMIIQEVVPYVRLGLALGAGASILVSAGFRRRIRNASTALMMPVMSKSASITRSQEPRSGYLNKNEVPGRMASRRISGSTR